MKKLISLVLATIMIVGSSVIATQALETETTDTPSTPTTFSFDVKSVGWSNFRNIYCHIYSIDGTGTWTAWQAKSERCSYDSSTGIATYDINTGISKAPDLANIAPENKWCIMFSANTGLETYPLLLNSNCYGDTAYAPDKNKKFENNVDSEKTSVELRWKNNTLLTAPKTITSTGKIQGEAFAYGETDETILASYLMNYYYDNQKTKLTESLISQLNVNACDVFKIVLDKVSKNVAEGYCSMNSANKMLLDIKSLLSNNVEFIGIKRFDMNFDKIFDVNDVTYLQKILAGKVKNLSNQYLVFDGNGDENFDVNDVTYLQKLLADRDSADETIQDN